MSRIIIGLSGYAGVGKDTVADLLVEHHGFTKVSFADPLRAMAAAINPIVNGDGPLPQIRYNEAIERFGYTEAKRRFPEIRQFLQRLGTDAVRNVLGQNVWADKWYETVRNVPGNVVAADVRFENEAFVCKSHGGVNVRVTRPGYGPVNDHVSESRTFMVDHTIDNNGGPLELMSQVTELIYKLG